MYGVYLQHTVYIPLNPLSARFLKIHLEMVWVDL